MQATNSRQFGVGAKIITGYAVVLVILVIIAVVLLSNLRTLVDEFTFVADHDFQVLLHAKELEKLMIDMETGERGFLLTGVNEFLEPYNNAQEEFDVVSTDLFELISDNPLQTARLQEIVALKEEWVTKVAEPYIQRRTQLNASTLTETTMGGFNALMNSLKQGGGKQRMDAIRIKFDEFILEEQSLDAQRVATANNTVNVLQSVVIGITGIGVVAGLGAGVYLGRTISSNIRKVMEAAQAVAQGDLSKRVTVNSNDEVARLAEAFNVMAANLQQTMASQVAKEYLESMINQYRSFVARVTNGDLTTRLELKHNGKDATEDDLYQLGVNLNAMVEGLAEMALQIREAAAGISSSSAEILASTTQQIASATEQDAAVTQTIATVEEVRQTVKQTADRAKGVAETSLQSVEVTRTGQDSVSDSVAGMKLIQQRVESIAENILMLSERTQQIGEIIETVNEIASQSKLLALNASIEAARAGEEGKGFAVVAMEVRQLAEQSREATARVRDILNQIQQATNTAVMVTEEGSKGAESGMSLVERAGIAIRELATVIEGAAQAAAQIAASTHQQTNGMDQLSSAMLSIKQATNQTAVSTKQAEKSAQDLNQMAQQMQKAVARYQLN